jgi:signal transduction histidine kinase
MKNSVKFQDPSLEELVNFREEVERLRAMSAKSRATEARLARLADFPEKNPDILVETDSQGRVTYLNLVAQARFPTIWQKGFGHPLLHGMADIVQAMAGRREAYCTDEISLGEYSFERQICCAHGADSAPIRIYVHDVTRHKQAEKAIQNLAKQVVYAQEEERRRLSRELHDEAGQALTALKLSLELLKADSPSDAAVLKRNLGEAIALTESTMQCVRLLAHGLRPPALDTLGLNLALQAYCRDFAHRTQLAIKYRGCEVQNLSDAMTISLYRALQEALTNVAKHARASQVRVSLTHTDKHVRLTVVDDGCGTDLDATRSPTQQGGIGLLGMRERLRLLEGRLELRCAPGQGMRLAAILPLGGMT